MTEDYSSPILGKPEISASQGAPRKKALVFNAGV